jgi:DsbC/DsbD-like thiol-disulfide interchange protein
MRLTGSLSPSCRFLHFASVRRIALACLLVGLANCCRADEGLSHGTEAARVKAKAYLSVKRLPAGGECEIVVFVTVQDGWHINSNTTVKDWQIPTELTITSKYGTKLARVSYPKGRLARVPGIEEPAPVYERQATIRGVLAIPPEAAGQTEQFRIQLRYQACNARECEQPKAFRLSGKVPVAAEGETVEQANSELFPKAR